jgi:transcriptional regulator with XRE-family HTH domain
MCDIVSVEMNVLVAQSSSTRALSKATGRVAMRLDLSQKDLAAILGVSAATVSRICSGQKELDAASKEGELALYLVRIFRSLDALVGGNEEAMRAWLRAENDHLRGIPKAMLPTIAGLVHVAEYLDAMRGKL